VGGVIDSRSLHTLPLADRDFLDLGLLAPGTYPVEQGSNLQGASLVVNGTRADMNNFLLDGADNNDYTINQSLPFQIVDAMQEYRVQAGTSTAEFGRNGGAQFNTISRRGLSSFHGALFEFLRNSATSANDYFSAYNGGTFDEYAQLRVLASQIAPNQFPPGNPLADPTLALYYNRRHPRLTQNQFGGNVGGELMRNKLFGFFSYEGFRVSNPRPIFERVPGLEFRQSESTDPLVAALFNLYPPPNVPTTVDKNAPGMPPFTDPNNFAFFVGESANSTASNNYLGRMDWQPGNRSNMSFKYNVQSIGQIQGGAVPRTPTYPGSGTQVSGRNQNFSYNYVRQLSPQADNEFRAAFNRFRLDANALDSSVNPASLPTDPTVGFEHLNFQDAGLPTLLVGGQLAEDDLATLGANQGIPSARADNVWSLADNLTYIRGAHILKWGLEYRRIQLNTLEDGLGRGLLTFFSQAYAAFTNLPDVASIARVSPQFGGGFDRYFRTQSLDLFVQDVWRPLANFTLNYGVRYEVNTAPVELRNRLVNYYPALVGGKGGWVQANSTTVYDAFGKVIGTAPTPAPRAGFSTDLNNYGPHVGFAWNPRNNGKTVVRGAYALMYDQQPLRPSVNMILNPPFVYQNFSFFPNFTTASTFPPRQYFTNSPPAACMPASQCWYQVPYSTTAIDPNNRTPYVHQFNLGIQQQLGPNATFQAAYVGSAGHKLPLLVDIRDCPLSDVFNIPNSQSCFNPTAANPFPAATVLDQQNGANSIFNSLQVTLDTRNFHNLQLHVLYEWGKSIDDASSLAPQVFLVPPAVANLLVSYAELNPFETSEIFAAANNISPTLSLRPTFPIITTRPRLPQNSNDFDSERGRSDFDIAQRFVAAFIYDFPNWTGARRFGSGWQIAGITTVESGQPFTVFNDFFGIPLRPNLLHPPIISPSNSQATIDFGYVMGSFLSAFKPAINLQPGNLGRNTFTGASLINTDFSIRKSCYVGRGENKEILVGAEFYNLFNHPNLYEPQSQGGLLFVNTYGDGKQLLVPNPFYAQTLQARPQREIQFFVRLSF
jgi:hypothetical protein